MKKVKLQTYEDLLPPALEIIEKIGLNCFEISTDVLESSINTGWIRISSDENEKVLKFRESMENLRESYSTSLDRHERGLGLIRIVPNVRFQRQP